VSPRHRREHRTYHLVAKITSFPSEIQSECFKDFTWRIANI